MSSDQGSVRQAVAESLARSPVIGVVRTPSRTEAARQARLFIRGGLELIEITFSVPEATDLVEELRAERATSGPPWIGMGTVTDPERAQAAVDAGAEFVVSPNPSSRVAKVARLADRFLVLGALSCTEIVRAHTLGADIVKVYPLPPVGGAAYLLTVRQPLSDIPMLAAGGFTVDEIADYRNAGAAAFGIGSPLLDPEDELSTKRIAMALEQARAQEV